MQAKPGPDAGTTAQRRKRPAAAPALARTPKKAARVEEHDLPFQLAVAARKPLQAKALQHSRPTVDECRVVYAALAEIFPGTATARVTSSHGSGGQTTCLDSLIRTMLSQNTTDTTSARAFARLKAAFPAWEQVRTADPAAVEAEIKLCGLAATRTARMQAILQTLHAERGECSLEHLRQMPDADVKAELGRFKGVGPKTISCVLLFCLARAEFPVDTHVWKLSLSLGWVPRSASRDQTYAHLNAIVPGELKHALHIMLVAYGKQEKNDTKLLLSHCRAAPLQLD